MARVLFAIGRISPCAITRCMCSSGSARTQTVKHEASSSSSVPGSVTIAPLVAIIKYCCCANTASSASRSARRKVSCPNISKISFKVAPLRRSTSRSSSTNGTPRRSASMAPRVDLPPPRNPISAMRLRRAFWDGSLKVCTSNSRAFERVGAGSRSRNCVSSTRSSVGSAPSCTSCVTGRPMARAMRRNSTIEQLPTPASNCAR